MKSDTKWTRYVEGDIYAGFWVREAERGRWVAGIEWRVASKAGGRVSLCTERITFDSEREAATAAADRLVDEISCLVASNKDKAAQIERMAAKISPAQIDMFAGGA